MELMIPLQSRSSVPYYEQIYRYLKEEIKSQGLHPGSRLPSTRLLADHLKVSRSTTQMAYDQLLSEGYIDSVPCKGYYVAEIEELIDTGFANGRVLAAMAADDKTDRGDGGKGSAKLQEDIIDFSPRGIDLDSFPFNTWRKITRNTLVDDNKEMFAAGDVQGEPAFREAIRDYLHSARGVNCAADQIIVGAGSEYLLMLLSRILGPNRMIAMENPTYKQAYRVLTGLRYAVEPVRMDRHGLDVGLLRASGADTAYVMPSHQYPMGIVMPVKRRQELLSWAYQREGRYLIEDDYDSEFRYKGKPVPALSGMDTRDRVIYIGTFSRSIAPAIRVSYMVLPKPLLNEYRVSASFYASTVSRIDQNILYQFMTGGYYERHLNRMRSVYKAKHDRLLGGLKLLESQFEIRGEYAGVHLLLLDKLGRSENWLVDEARNRGVTVYGLSTYEILPEQSVTPATIVLGYASLKDEEIQKGIELLLQAWDDRR